MAAVHRTDPAHAARVELEGEQFRVQAVVADEDHLATLTDGREGRGRAGVDQVHGGPGLDGDRAGEDALTLALCAGADVHDQCARPHGGRVLGGGEDRVADGGGPGGGGVGEGTDA